MIQSGHVRFHDALEPYLVPIDEVVPHPDNYNNGDIEEIAESIEQNGMYRPIQVQRSSNRIVVGNHTWYAVKSLGSEYVPVVPLAVDDAQALKIMVADNEIARRAQPDRGQLVALLDQIKASGETIVGSGISDEEHETLRLLNSIPLDTQEFAQWPTLSIQLPPHLLGAFRLLTHEAEDDRQAFELLLRMAGWDS